MTFVCEEPLWQEMSQNRYVESLITASRIAVGRVSKENYLEARRSAFIYASLDSMGTDPALRKAVSLAVSTMPAISLLRVAPASTTASR